MAAFAFFAVIVLRHKTFRKQTRLCSTFSPTCAYIPSRFAASSAACRALASIRFDEIAHHHLRVH